MKSKIALVLVSTLFAFLLAEGLARFFLRNIQWEYRDSMALWKPHPVLGWVMKSNVSFPVHSADGTKGWTLKTNEDGVRPETAKREKLAHDFRVLIVGDSTVVGLAVPEEDNIATKLSARLREAGQQVEVVNAGVEGYSTDQALLRLEQLLPLYSPDLVLYCFCENDLAGNLVSENYGWSKPVFSVAPDGRLTMTKADDNRDFERRHFTSLSHRVISRSALYYLLRPALVRIKLMFASKQDAGLMGFRPEAFSVGFEWKESDWVVFRALIQRMKESSEKLGSRFALYSHPSLVEVWRPAGEGIERTLGSSGKQFDRYAIQNQLLLQAQSSGATYWPMVDYFLERQERGPFHLVPHDPHCNAAGYDLTAEFLAEKITPLVHDREETGRVAPPLSGVAASTTRTRTRCHELGGLTRLCPCG